MGTTWALEISENFCPDNVADPIVAGFRVGSERCQERAPGEKNTSERVVYVCGWLGFKRPKKKL